MRRLASSSVDGSNCSHAVRPPDDYQKKICEPAFFPPLTTDDEFDIFDIELHVDSGGKAKIAVRSRHGPNTRPIYKAEKTVKNHLLTKNLNMIISRNETWDPKTKTLVQGGRGYQPIWEGWNLNRRSLSVTATKSMVLYETNRGGAFTVTMSQSCGSYDPVKFPQSRDCLSHHFFPIHTTNFEAVGRSGHGSRPRTGSSHPSVAPDALERPYAGGGYFVFNCHSQGRKELLTTLYCTGYEKRHQIRNGDIVVAELRLPFLPTDNSPGKEEIPAWGWFLKERYAVLHISRRGAEAAFYGNHVKVAVPNSDGRPLSSGQAQEIIISTVSMMLLSIDHERGDKKWEWMINRTLLEHRIGASMGVSKVTADDDLEKASVTDSSTSVPASLTSINTFGDHWSQRSYTGDFPTDSPVSETRADAPFTLVEERRHYLQAPDHDPPSSQVQTLFPPSPKDRLRKEISEHEQLQYFLIDERKEHYSEVPNVQNMAVHELPAPHQLSKYFPHPPSYPPNACQDPLVYSYPGPGEMHQPPHDSLQAGKTQTMQPTNQNVQESPPQPSAITNSVQHLPLTAVLTFPLPVPVHPASLTSWAEDNRPEPEECNSLTDAAVPRKEGPKVTGRPQSGEEGGIFW